MRLMTLIAPWRAEPAKRTPKRRARAKTEAKRHRVHRGPDWRFRRRVAASALGALLLGGLIGLWSNGWIDRQADKAWQSALNATAKAGLRVEDVLVEGRDRTARSRILETLKLTRGDPILGFDPHGAKVMLERLPWVREAEVVRRLPNVVFVRLAERIPLALWQNNGKLTVIDGRGEVVPGAPPEAFASLPLLVGEDVPRHALKLISLLDSEPDLRPRVAAAVLVRGRRWNVRLDGGIDVRLPENDPRAAWAQLAQMQREQGVLERDVIAIDLRMPDRLVVRTAPGVKPRRGKARAGEET
jgi:cell division protein FtsQ